MSVLPPSFLAKFSDFLADTMGLYFPKEGWKDFERKLQPICNAFGFKDTAACLEWLMKSPLTKEQITLFALYLTVGETYFFRDATTFKHLESSILPEIIKRRRGKHQYLRIWSCACCTGEEPYSIAILLQELLPDLQDWNISILGTDINTKFLQKAESGIYKEWSFRSIPKSIKEKYFTKRKDGLYSLNAEIKKMVSFQYLNLVEDEFPKEIDLILCNNVLIYFSPKHIKQVVHRLSSSLMLNGWLVVSSIEVPFIEDPSLSALHFTDKSFFKKGAAAAPTPIVKPEFKATSKPKPSTPKSVKVELPAFLNLPSPVLEFNYDSVPTIKPIPPSVKEPEENYYQDALELFNQWQYDKAATKLEHYLKDSLEESKILKAHSDALILLTKAYANLGKLTEARNSCEKVLLEEKLDPLLYYLYASILHEQDHFDEAVKALKHALFLDPNFLMAQFALGNLMVRAKKDKEAQRYFRNALTLVKNMKPNEELVGAEGMTAGYLMKILLDMQRQCNE